MPKIGEIRKGTEIGYKSNWYMWCACEECEKERWVQVKKGVLKYRRCLICAHNDPVWKSRISESNRKRGHDHSGWRGGRIQTKRGYVLVWLSKDDFFHQMANISSYVMEHRLVVAKRLGRNLHSWEVVHHKDRIKNNNDDNNLQLYTDTRHNQLTILENKIANLEKRNKVLEQRLVTK